MRLLSLLASFLVAGLGITFALLNSEDVVINYYIGSQSLPLSLLIVSFFILGILIGFSASLPLIIRQKLQLRKQSRED
jgi:putative membrane protein